MTEPSDGQPSEQPGQDVTEAPSAPADTRMLDSAEAEAALEALDAVDEEPVAAPRRRARHTRAPAAAGAAEPPGAPETPSENLEPAPTRAAAVSIDRGSTGAIAGDRVDVRFGAVGRVETDYADVRTGAVGFVRGAGVSLQRSSVGGMLADEATAHQSFVRALLARSVRLQQSGARSVVAEHVTFERQSGALVVLAARVDGEVRALLDWRGALAFGAAFGLIAAVFGRRPRGQSAGGRRAAMRGGRRKAV